MRALFAGLFGSAILSGGIVFAQGSRRAAAHDMHGVFATDRSLPDLTLPGLNGSSRVDLSGLRGRRVVLLQFASW